MARALDSECSVFDKTSAHCQSVLQTTLHNIISSGNWSKDGDWGPRSHLISKRSILSQCLAKRTLLFVGSSFMRTMLIGFLEELTGRKHNTYIESRHPGKFCGNLDGYDVTACGWPASKWWLVERQGRNQYTVVKEVKYSSPPKTFPPEPEKDQWLIVFQFKTFVLTPELDTEVIRQARGYKADLLVLETGIWGFLPWFGSMEFQTETLLKTIREGFTTSHVIFIIDGFHHGMIGPHVVNSSIAAPVLNSVAQQMGLIRFDRTGMLESAHNNPALAESMSRHGYAGAVSNLHTLMLFSLICN
jgi:hypothetical protein